MSTRSRWLLPAILIIAGCASTTPPPLAPFPRPDSQMMEKPERPQPLGPRRPVSVAGALPAITANYAACNRTADRLDALQTWVREEFKATNGQDLSY